MRGRKIMLMFGLTLPVAQRIKRVKMVKPVIILSYEEEDK